MAEKGWGEMVVLTDSRDLLDTALADNDTTILILTGSEGSKAGEIHAFIDEYIWEDWHRWFLVTKVSILTPTMRTKWVLNNMQRYVALGGTGTKRVGAKGSANKLLRPNNEPSMVDIEEAFANGDGA